MKVEISAIEWNTEGIEDSGLPSAAIVDVDEADPTDAEDMAVDILSEQYGYCVLSVGDITARP